MCFKVRALFVGEAGRGKRKKTLEWYRTHPRSAEDSVLAKVVMASDRFVVLLLTYLIEKCYGRELEDALTGVYLQAARVGVERKGGSFISCFVKGRKIALLSIRLKFESIACFSLLFFYPKQFILSSS